MDDMDMSLKTYKCTQCGTLMSSKHPVLRSIFIKDDDLDLTTAVILRYISAITLTRVSDDSARRGDRELQNLRTREKWTSPPGKDLEIRITIPDESPSELLKEPDLQDPAKVLLRWLKSIRRLPDEYLPRLICSLVGGHKWERITEAESESEQQG